MPEGVGGFVLCSKSGGIEKFTHREGYMRVVAASIALMIIAGFTSYADSYKGYEWGVPAQTLIDQGELQFDNGKSYSDIEASSYFRDDVTLELFGLYLGIPYVLRNPDQQPLEVPRGITPVMYKVLKHVNQVQNYHFDADLMPNLKWAKGKAGDIAFYQDCYFFYQSNVELGSFDSVLNKLKTKYGKSSYYSDDSKVSQIDTFTSYTWVNGDTVVFLAKMLSGSQSYDHKECILAYMNKSVGETIKAEIKKNF